MDGDRATGVQRRLGQRDDAAVLKLMLDTDRSWLQRERHSIVNKMVGVDDGRPVDRPPFQDGPDWGAGLGQPGVKCIHSRVFSIADDQALLVVEHREPLRHALQRGVEMVA